MGPAQLITLMQITLTDLSVLCRWFHGCIDRTDVEKRLFSAPVGSFLVRSVIETGAYSLCVRDVEKVKFYRIRYIDDDTRKCFITRRVCFDTVQELIAYYSCQADGLCTTLSTPCQLVEPLPTAGLSRKTNKTCKIERDLIQLKRQLGAGQFCDVWGGVWNGMAAVAVKVFKSGIVAPSEFLSEVVLMKQLQHTNVIQVYGLCAQEDPIYMVMELMKHGSLLEYLRGDGRSLKLPQLIDMGAQVAAGMAYLEEKNYIHQDLAARNILVSENLICKVADFGLARVIDEDIYEAHTGAKFPIKWTAPEAAMYNCFTVKSDVWSFGILLYELITYDRFPYPGMNNAEVLEALQTGYRMPCPMGCPELLHQIMLKCWKDDAASRLTFETLHWQLDDFFHLDEQLNT